MTSRSIVALLTETELSRFAHSASDPLGEGAAGAGASAVEERRTEGAAMGGTDRYPGNQVPRMCVCVALPTLCGQIAPCVSGVCLSPVCGQLLHRLERARTRRTTQPYPGPKPDPYYSNPFAAAFLRFTPPK